MRTINIRGPHFQHNLYQKIDHPLFPLAAARRLLHNSMEYTTAVGNIVLLTNVAAVQHLLTSSMEQSPS